MSTPAYHIPPHFWHKSQSSVRGFAPLHILVFSRNFPFQLKPVQKPEIQLSWTAVILITKPIRPLGLRANHWSSSLAHATELVQPDGMFLGLLHDPGYRVPGVILHVVARDVHAWNRRNPSLQRSHKSLCTAKTLRTPAHHSRKPLLPPQVSILHRPINVGMFII